jgi:hypothetical protein
MEKEYFVLRRAHCGTFNMKTGKMDSDIIGITDDEEFAKSQVSVFCYYEKVRFINRELSNEIKEIAETYHDREVMSCQSGLEKKCDCCDKKTAHSVCIEHDSQDYSKDKWVCPDCYVRIATYWKEHAPKKICPI